MQLTTTKTPIIEKTEELCQTILDQDSVKELQLHITTFANDSDAQLQYQNLIDKQELLQGKQQQGVSLTDEEIADFEKERDALLANTVAAAYIEAQQQMHNVQDTILRYVAKTFELGRLPTEDDMQSGGCCGGGGGGGCGCQ